jgi:hypothetical protein
VTPAPDDRQAALDAFAQWASAQPRAPRDAGSLAGDVAASHDYVGLLSTEIEGRSLAWKSVPAGARVRVTVADVTIETLDLWNLDVRTLRERSDHVTICPVCSGERKIRCASCRGLGTTTCASCWGTGRRSSLTSRGRLRFLNCPACRGRGSFDCRYCRHGLANCHGCQGEGRLQRWLELTSWHRTAATVQTPAMGRQLGWDGDPADDLVTHDAQLNADISLPQALHPSDLGTISPRWLDLLQPELKEGERVRRQRLRIADVATHTVQYRLGGDEDRARFAGRHLAPPAADEPSAFTRRGARLRAVSWLSIVAYAVLATVMLGRGPFYRSLPTLLILVALAGAFGALYGAIAEWTGRRQQTRRWLTAVAICLLLTAALTFAGLPRLAHAGSLIAAGQLDDAEEELSAFGGDAGPATWADLYLARIGQASDLETARAVLAKIPPTLPQHAAAVTAVDGLILRTATDALRTHQPGQALDALKLLSDEARGHPERVAAAKAILIPLGREMLDRKDSRGAADALEQARRLGAGAAELEPLTDGLHTAARAALALANDEDQAEKRLQLRLAAEMILLSWERAVGESGTPELLNLRSKMANDVAILERGRRRRHAS